VDIATRGTDLGTNPEHGNPPSPDPAGDGADATELRDWNQELVSFESQERFDFAAKVNDGKSTRP
jgi:hypothetical protein